MRSAANQPREGQKMSNRLKDKVAIVTGSGRGIDVTGAQLHGKGVGLGEMAVHFSIQPVAVQPAKPIIR